MAPCHNRPQRPHRVKNGCDNCRLRHLKCDDHKASCQSCRAEGRVCTRRVRLRFRHGWNPSISHPGKSTAALQQSFDPDQHWCRVHRSLTFINQTREIVSLHEENGPQTLPDSIASEESISTASVHLAASETVSPPAESATILCLSPIQDIDFPLPSPRLCALQWPLADRTEASLFRYFIELLAQWFDLCDHARTFALVVPCRSVLYAPLRNAIFAISAKYLALTRGTVDMTVADRYYDRCLATLRPMLADEAALVDENLFAAAVILRNYEEIDVPLTGAHPSTHLLGNSLFVKASATLHNAAGTSAPLLFAGLRRAAFLVAVRQEIYTAFVSQRSIEPWYSSGADLATEVSPDDCNDCDWSNRAVFLLADTLRFCYGRDDDCCRTSDQLLARYDHLVAYSRRWYDQKPLSFVPLYFCDPLPLDVMCTTLPASACSSALFPDIWLLSDTVATGLQHYYLVQILLAAFDPRTPRIGPARAAFARDQDGRIRMQVCLLVGIAKSNPQCRPHFVSACMGIVVAGERFEERWQQEAILEFLEETEALCAWQTDMARERLSAAWGWGK